MLGPAPKKVLRELQRCVCGPAFIIQAHFCKGLPRISTSANRHLHNGSDPGRMGVQPAIGR